MFQNKKFTHLEYAVLIFLLPYRSYQIINLSQGDSRDITDQDPKYFTNNPWYTKRYPSNQGVKNVYRWA